MKYPTKSVCVVDGGLFEELAVTLAQDFGKVFYHCPWQHSPFPRSNASLVGLGLPGLTLAPRFWDVVPDTDLFVFPDVYQGDLQVELEVQGKKIFGSLKGDELELNRLESKKHLQSLGIPVGPYEPVKGLAALRRYLKEHEDQWVKCSVYRGDFETFPAPNYKFIESKLDSLEQSLGVKKYFQEFIVEQTIKGAIEIASDGFCIFGKYPGRSLLGIETKSKAYLGQMRAEAQMPGQIREFNAKLAPTLKDYGYRNFMSAEMFIKENGEWFVSDPCMRAGNPPLAVQLLFYENLAEIIWEGAQGKVVEPTSKFQWAAQLQLTSDWLDTNVVNVQFPEKLRENVKLINGLKYNGEYYLAPRHYKITNVGAVVAGGQTLQEAKEQCKEIAAQVKGYFIECNPEALDEAEEEWGKFESQ